MPYYNKHAIVLSNAHELFFRVLEWEHVQWRNYLAKLLSRFVLLSLYLYFQNSKTSYNNASNNTTGKV